MLTELLCYRCRRACVVRLGPRPLSSRIDSSSRVASPSHVALRVACLRMSLSSRAVNGWWCWVFAPSRGARPPWPFVAGGVVMSLCRGQGWPLTFPQRPCQRWARLLYDRHPGAANEVSEVGGDDDGVVTHIPQHPRHVRGVGTPLIRYRARTVVLGLQTRLVRWGVMTMGGCSPSPAPSHVCGMGASPVRCRACTCICCIEGCADGGRR